MTWSRKPSWPVTALLVGYPLWWALGVADFMWIVLAIPMGARLIGWHVRGTRTVRAPRGFGFWLLFLVCVVAGAAVLGVSAPGTAPSSISHRILSYLNRTASYVGITVLFLYVGNLTERELSRRRLAQLLGIVAVYTTIGGLAAMLKPHLAFSSPLEFLLPHGLQSNPFIRAVTHPALAQLQNVLGTATNARPKAPFDYTNTWSECLTILIPWLLVGWWGNGTRRTRLVLVGLTLLAAVPLLYSLNRAAWMGAGLSIVYLVRQISKHPRALIAGLAAACVVGGVVVVATPLTSVISARLARGGSSNLRAGLSQLAVTDALASPVIGYGDTRKQIASAKTIARGPSQRCPLCGQQEVGSTGQLWLLLVCNGVLGAALYVIFFTVPIWRYRHDRTAYGQAGVLVLLLSSLYMFTYDAVPAALGFTMLAYALLWRNEVPALARARIPVLAGTYGFARPRPIPAETAT